LKDELVNCPLEDIPGKVKEFVECECKKMYPKVIRSYLFDVACLLQKESELYDKRMFNQLYEEFYSKAKKLKGNC